MAIMSGDNPSEYSESDAFVMFSPVAHGASPNMLVQSEFLRRVFKKAGAVDDQGKYKPVVFLASPELIKGSDLRLNDYERRLIADGDQGSFVRPMMDAVTWRGYGSVALAGFSQAGTLVLRAASEFNSPNLDITKVASGASPNNQRRGYPRIGLDFFKTGTKALRQSIELGGLDAQKAVINAADGRRTLFSFPIPDNRSLIHGLGVNNIKDVIQQLLDEGRIHGLVSAYGSEDLLTKPKYIEPILQDLHNVDINKILTSIKVKGANHAWGDYLPLLAKLYTKAAV
jgi:hypothetical protein